VDLSNVPLTQVGERLGDNTYLIKINFAVKSWLAWRQEPKLAKNEFSEYLKHLRTL
jgi:hypothetical protein